MSRSTVLVTALALAEVALAAGAAAGCGARLSGRRQLTARVEQAASLRVDYRCEAALPDDGCVVVNDPEEPCVYADRVRARGVWLAYLSVGEVNESLPCFDDLLHEGALLGENPHWPGAYYVDVTHPAFRQRYLEPRLQIMAARGFQGIFLDTLDSAIDGPGAQDPARARATVLAAVQWMRALHPEWIIVPNGGLSLDALVPIVDAWAIEDVFGGYDWARRSYADTSPARQAIVLPALRRLRRRGLPVFVLDYAAKDDTARRSELLARCRAEGLRCTIDAMPGEVVDAGAPRP